MSYESESGKKKSFGSMLITLLIVILIAGSVFAGLYFDVLGVKSKYLYPTLSKVPVFKNIIKVEEKPTGLEGKTTEELIAQINQNETELKSLKEEIENKKSLIEQKDKEIVRLKVFEEQQITFKKEKQTFDQNVVHNSNAPDIKAYIEYYEKMNPETAAEIYTNAIKQVQDNEQIRKSAETYEYMDPTNAATILEKLSLTDMNLVITILNKIDGEQRAKILESMDSKSAARITRQLMP